MDDGILYPDKPIDIVKESDTTALVDGNLGLGLYIGPHCMQMAIDKAKKFGVGFVACRNSTVSEEGRLLVNELGRHLANTMYHFVFTSALWHCRILCNHGY